MNSFKSFVPSFVTFVVKRSNHKVTQSTHKVAQRISIHGATELQHLKVFNKGGKKWR